MSTALNVDAVADADQLFRQLDASASFASLRFSGQRLLLPQGDVEILELLSELRPVLTPGTVGEIVYRGRPWPVYGLSETLTPRARLDPSSYVCALLKSAGGGYFGIGCDEVNHVARAELGKTLQPVPGCMRAERLLVCGLAVGNAGPLWLATAAHAERWLAANEEQFHELM